MRNFNDGSIFRWKRLLTATFFCVSLFPVEAKTQSSPLFQRVAAQGTDTVFDSRTWSFYTGAPVRATALAAGGRLYFGNAKGDFFSIDQYSGRLKWKWQGGSAIHSSAIADKANVYFSDNRQVLYALDLASGKLRWQFKLGKKKDYPWRFDYYYSSPVFRNGQLFIGSDDGCFYAIDAASGRLLWKYQTAGIIRSTAAVDNNTVFFGDTEASLYALDRKTGKQRWVYKINGDSLNNEGYGFDRRAITASPVLTGGKLIVGARDGYLYCIDALTGKSIWKVDHQVSWIISTVAVKGNKLVTGTSDGRFVQALDLETGGQLWKYPTTSAVWASPLIIGDKVYAAGFNAELYCLDLNTGRRVSQFNAGGRLLSSPVYNSGFLYIGSDDGYMYALKGNPDQRWFAGEPRRYVYYEPGVNVYFKNNADLAIRNYLNGNGFLTVNADTLKTVLSSAAVGPVIVVFASAYFPTPIIKNGGGSLLRSFLDEGGRVVLAGMNPLVFKIDPVSKQPVDYNRHLADTILGLDYGAGDTRSFMGEYPSFANSRGKELGLPDYWTNSVFIARKNIDISLGENENGDVSAFVKKYAKGGSLVQLWMDESAPAQLDALIKAAEWKWDKK